MKMEPKNFIEKAFQTLINTKHLYQKVDVNFEPYISEHAKKLFAAQGLEGRRPLEDVRGQVTLQLHRRGWVLDSPGVGNMRPGADDAIHFSLLPVKTMCGNCNAVESFNAWDGFPALAINTAGSREQVFCVPIQCQACKRNVMVLLVHRNGTRIQLVGRSEFEEVLVPEYIPKQQKRFYSQALIAFQSGQVLPGLFLLRTLIEQHMRAVTKREDLRGEELCDEYAKTLADEVKRTFPSFREIYGKLSDALHKADSNEELFEGQLRDIEIHFEGVAVHAKAKRK